MKRKQPDFTIVVDTREQFPLVFDRFAALGVSTVRRKLQTGDYSIDGFERQIVIERKSLNDCVSTLTHGRERFTREIYDRSIFTPVKLLVVEASWQELAHPYDFAPGANPKSIINSLFAIMMPPAGFHVFCDPNRDVIAWFVVKFCYMFLHRAHHSSAGIWRALFDQNAAEIPPFQKDSK